MKKINIAVFIARLQPIHNGHIHIIKQALQEADHLLILLGGANQPCTVKDPWTVEQRTQMIRGCLDVQSRLNVTIGNIPDYLYNPERWTMEVQRTVDEFAHDIYGKSDATIALIGHHKDKSSSYLDDFPQWKSIEVDRYEDLNATDIRNVLFNVDGGGIANLDPNLIPTGCYDVLKQFVNSHKYKHLCGEFEFYQAHNKMWDTAPYPVKFITADAVVFQGGHVLLVQRKNHPGKNLWAIPGGYLDDELIIDCAIRELREETRLKVPVPVLQGSVFASHVFDNPNRSLRGRIVTHAFGFKLAMPTKKLQEVRGSSDAIQAKWVPLNQVKRNDMFEDHYDIIQFMIDRLLTHK